MIDSEEKAAFLGASSGAKTMADGTLRIQVDISPLDAIGAFIAFGAPGSPVAIARVTNEAALEADREDLVNGPVGGAIKMHGPYGEYAKTLKLSGFFRTPGVWVEIGTDAQYLEWVRRQKSAISNEYSWKDMDTGENYCVPAHVRRVEHGSGTGIKPSYSAIPLTNDEHQQSHQHGDTNLRPEEWWDKMRIKYVSQWAWLTLKEQLGYESWSEVPPVELRDWALKHDVLRSLPNSYKIIHDAEIPTEG